MIKVDPAMGKTLKKLLEFRRIKYESPGDYTRKLRIISSRIRRESKPEKLSKFFLVLSDPARIMIIQLLKRKRRMCVCEFVVALRISQPLISYHLRQLENIGLVRRTREGKWVFYEISNKTILRLLDSLMKWDTKRG